jgi:hypothetical protein
MSIPSTALTEDEKRRGGTSKPDPLANYYNDDDLARIFRRSKRTIARWRAQRRLAFTMAGKTPISSPDHVQQFLRANEVKPVPVRRRA